MNQKTSTLKIEEMLSFPKDGDIVSGVKVSSAKCKIKDGKLSYRICLPRGTRRADVPNIFRAFYTTGMITLDGVDTVIQDHNYRIKPTRTQTIVTGSASVIPLSLTNPVQKQMTAMEDFNQEYSKMEMAEPGTYFRVFPYRGFDGPAFRSKLFSLVSTMGENYGYCDDKKLYHRRASLVMPKIKITKAPPNAKMFYHTHPKKDEPSLSSADDYLVYFDMSHKPLNIRHFYTVMADRMDYFHVVPKHSKKKDYVKLNEDKFIEEVDNAIDDAGKRLDEKLPNETYEDNLYYCERVTREVVKFLNKKYGKYFTITYRCHYKVKKNPDKPTGSDLHLDDELIAKGLNDIKSGKYSWPKFSTKDKPHEEYAYWHSRYFSLNQDARGVGYTGLMPGDMRRLEVFLYDQYRGSNFTYDDILGILCLSYDIRMRDSKIRDGKRNDTRINEILDFLEITDNVIREDIIMLDSILAVDAYGDLAQEMGSHQFILPLADFSIKSVEAMTAVKKGKKGLEMVKYEINVKLKEKMAKAVAKSLGEENEKVGRDIYDDEGEIIDPARTVPVYGADGLVQKAVVNPPIEIKKIDYKAFLPVEIFDNPELIKEIFEKFKKEGKDVLTVKNQYNIAVPVGDTAVGMKISISNGYVEFTYPSKGYTATMPAEEAVVSTFRTLIEELNSRGFEIPTDDIAIGVAEPMRNPNDAMIISISGLVQPTKKEILKSLEKRLDGEIVRTYTTRTLKEYEKRFNLVEVSDETFSKMANNGDLIVVTNSLDGSRRGFLRKDFQKAKYILVDSQVADIPFLLQTDPGIMSFYLQPTNSEAEIKKIMMEDVSPQEADRVAKLATDKDYDINVEVDYVISYDVEKPAGALEEIFQSIPKKNPGARGSVFFPGNGSNYYLTARTIPITALQGNPNPYYEAHLYASGSKDPFFPGDVPVAPPALLKGVEENPRKKIQVRIQESTNPEKKLMAIFTKPNGRTKTTHFGARGMSDYTQHKDPKRQKNYLARHGKMGEDWNNPTTAGALSRWILWGKPSLRESFNDFKKRFNLEGVMAVTNTKMNPRIPKKYEGQDPSEHSDLYTDEDPEGTIQGLGFKDAETAKKSIQLIKKADRTHAHKIQAAMAMEQRARFHPNATKGIKEAQKIYADFIEEMKEKTKEMRNPSRTPEGRKIPKKYLKGLNKEEMAIAAKEIDKGYKYDIDDPKAYEYWKSDIKATARGYKTVPSKYKKKFIEMYGPLPEEGKFLDKMAKATKIKKSILEKVYDKGLAAWRGGHRPGVQQHQWAAGRVYSFVTLGNTVKKGKKKMSDYSLAVEAGLIKKNPSKYREAAGGIVMDGDRILLLRRSTKETSKHGMWEFPGGKLEEGETAEQAAIIETQEESGLDVVVKGKAGEHIDHRMEKVYHAFFVEPVNVNQEVKLSEEHDQSLWVTIDEALAMEESKLSHHARHFLEQMVRNNPGWRHGEQMENDPFADEFEE